LFSRELPCFDSFSLTATAPEDALVTDEAALVAAVVADETSAGERTPCLPRW
jgi:hypothetical protein